MNTKAKNDRNVNKSKKWLEERGWKVLKTSGRASLCDLVALSKEKILLVHVVTNSWTGRQETDNKRLFFACPPNCIKEIHLWKDGEIEPEIKTLSAVSERRFKATDGRIITERKVTETLPALHKTRK